MIPIGDENRGRRGLPVVTITLVVINVLVFLYQNTLSLEQLNSFILTYGVIPARIEAHQDFYTLLTSMFVHGGFAHIAGNMLFLWIFSDNIEQRFGPVLFLLFYLGCGLAASGAHILADPHSVVPTVGASGAISGVMGAYTLLYPRNRVRVLIFFFGVMQVPAFIFLGIWFLTQFLTGVATLGVQTAQSSGVAVWAHVGGFATGIIAGGILGAIRREPPRSEAELALWRDRDDSR